MILHGSVAYWLHRTLSGKPIFYTLVADPYFAEVSTDLKISTARNHLTAI
jgi:hypothetical protein